MYGRAPRLCLPKTSYMSEDGAAVEDPGRFRHGRLVALCRGHQPDWRRHDGVEPLEAGQRGGCILVCQGASAPHATAALCRPYSGAASFGKCSSAHALEPAAFYIAFRDETASHIQDAIALRRQAQAVADSTTAGPLTSILSRLTSRSDGGDDVRRAL